MARGMTIALAFVSSIAAASLGLAAILYEAPPDDGKVVDELPVDVKPTCPVAHDSSLDTADFIFNCGSKDTQVANETVKVTTL